MDIRFEAGRDDDGGRPGRAQHVVALSRPASGWASEADHNRWYGEKTERYTDIPDSYDQARTALKYKMILGENRIIHYTQVSGEGGAMPLIS